EARRRVDTRQRGSMGKTMTAFYDLFLSRRDLMPGEQQRVIEQEFPGVVARSALRWWSPHSVVPASGTRLVIGVASYSDADMRLLDLVHDAVAKSRHCPPEPLCVEV